MNRPLIGISASGAEDGEVRLSVLYLEALWAAGAVGVILPNRTATDGAVELYARKFQGFLFAGGGDIHPSYYGKDPDGRPLAVDGVRDRFEAALFRAVYPTGKPILGICRGMQVINVFLGGTLHRHVDGHQGGTHRISILPDTTLSKAVGRSDWTVNTFHHQSVDQVAEHLAICAVSDDQVVESVCHTDHPYLLGVQFHPEKMAPTDVSAKALFKSFVSACIKP